MNEIQLLKCLATSGSFALYFNGEVSPLIRYNANQNALTAGLLMTSGITGMKVRKEVIVN